LAGPAALVGSVLMMGGGMLISLIASLASLPSLVMLTGLGILLGDKLPLLLEAASAYGGGLAGVVTSIADLAVHFGILSEEDAIGILEDLGIQIDEFDDEKIDSVAKSIEDIAGAISRGVEDLVEWKDAFGIFLEDVENREGAVGSLVGHLERLYEILGDLYQTAAPKLGLPTGPYEELGPEEKAGLIDKFAGLMIGSKIASWIFAGLAAGLKTVLTIGGVAAILKAFGVVGTGATATATGGGVVAAAGIGIGAALAGAITLALGAGITAYLMVEGPKWAERFQQRFPWFKTKVFGPELTPEQMEEIAGTEARRREEYAEFFRPLREAFTEHLIPPLKEAWEGFYAWLIDYPSQQVSQLTGEVSWLQRLFPTPQIEGLFTPADPTMERFLNFIGLLSKTDPGAPALTAETKFYLKNAEEFDAWIDKWDWANIESGETEHKASTKFDLKNRPEYEEVMKNMRWLEGHHTAVYDIYFRYHGEEPPKHLGGYPMHEGGYPPLGMPNILASEFVLSPHTTRTLESYLGRLDQQKVRSVVNQPRIGMTVNFFKGSVTSKEDAEEAAEIIFDRMADRASGLARMET